MTKQDITLLGQAPPQVLEIEEAVLGAIMIEKPALLDVIDLLRPEYFYKPAHQEVYRAILDLFAISHPVDMLTVTQQLRQAAKIEMVGGPTFLMKLTSLVNSAANIEYHARLIVEQALKRRLIDIAYQARKEAFEPTSDVFDITDQLAAQVLELTETGAKSQVSRGSDIIFDIMRNFDEEVNNPKLIQNISVPSGLYDLDQIIGGFENATVTVLAARPAMGKTAFALNLAINATERFGRPTAFFSLEMSKRDLGYRLLSMLSGVESRRIKKRELNEEEVAQVRQAERVLHDLDIFIDDTPQLSILQLKAKLRRLVFSHKIQFAIVDYLQLMTASGKVGQNREQEIASIARALKQISKELDIPIVALAQISRAVENRTGSKRPQLSDLRESGEIEQLADIVGFLYRADYYGITEDSQGNSTRGVTELILAKHRNGETGTVLLEFIPQHQKFQNLQDRFWQGEESAFPDRPPQALPAANLRGFTQNPDSFEK